ncbi:MAG: CAP domain-containing protein, partial [bacterium]|nr:CAP domain-containing protein [bacterium]
MLVTSQNRLVTVCRGAACVVVPHPTNAYRPYLFRHPVLGFLNALILCATLGASLLISLTPDVARLSTITAPTLVKLTNAERQKAGLPPLSEHSGLVRSAQLKGEHMLRHDYFDHTSPDGVSPWAWFNRTQYPYLYAGENLAIDFSDAGDVVTAWVKSPGHRRNLLSDRYNEIGMAVVTGEFEGRTATIVVQHFGRRPASAEPSAQLSASGLPLVASESRARETPAPLAAPQILEPREEQTVSVSPATVRGTAPSESRVQLSFNGTAVGTFDSEDDFFRGTFSLPENQEEVGVLRARALKDGQVSAWSAPRTLRIDTKGPDVTMRRAVLLPDPQQLPGAALLVVPAE